MKFFSCIPMSLLQRKFVVSSDFLPFFLSQMVVSLKNNPFYPLQKWHIAVRSRINMSTNVYNAQVQTGGWRGTSRWKSSNLISSWSAPTVCHTIRLTPAITKRPRNCFNTGNVFCPRSVCGLWQSIFPWWMIFSRSNWGYELDNETPPPDMMPEVQRDMLASLGFLRTKPDGSTSLPIITPQTGVVPGNIWTNNTFEVCFDIFLIIDVWGNVWRR
jgi:hypothetical protein